MPKPLRAAALATLFAIATAAGAPQPTEYELKAVYLFHFTEFVSWPESAFSGPDAPFVIGIIGADPFGDALSEVVQRESVGTHPIVVRRVEDLAAERGCQILYVVRGWESHLHAHQLENLPILTVGESDTLSQEPEIVEFVNEHNRVHLKIDLAEARAHGLGVSAKLLRVAEVTGAPNPSAER